MKLVFLGTSLTILYYMRLQSGVRATHDKEQDTFRVVFLIVPCAVLALLINQEFGFMEVCTYAVTRIQADFAQLRSA